MSERKRVVVYPFTREFLPWFEYFQTYNPDYRIVSLAAPKGFRMDGKDASWIDQRSAVGMNVTEDIDAALLQAEALLVADSPTCRHMRERILDVMRKAAEHGLEILCSLSLTEEERAEFPTETFCDYSAPSFVGEEYVNVSKLERLNVPVVFVGELLEDTNAVDILFQLAYRFRRDGYRVSAIGERKDSRLAGIHSYPAFFYEPMLGEEKATRLNRFLYELEKEEQPDLILIQLPGGMLKYNDRHTNGMGIGAYLVSQAVSCDCFVLSESCGLAAADMFRDLDQKFRLCFGFGINAVGISNRVYDSTTQVEVYGKMEYYCLSAQRVDELLETYCSGGSIPFYRIFQPEDAEKLYQTVISSLTGQTLVY